MIWGPQLVIHTKCFNSCFVCCLYSTYLSLSNIVSVWWNVRKLWNNVFVIFENRVEVCGCNSIWVSTFKLQVASSICQSLQRCTLKLKFVANNQENNESQRNRVNNWCHFVSHPVCRQIFQYHLFHWFLFEKQEKVSEDYLKESLKIKSQKT